MEIGQDSISRNGRIDFAPMADFNEVSEPERADPIVKLERF